MDNFNLLCDELIQEILLRLPPSTPTSSSPSLVSKRWLHLYRTSKTSLSIQIPPHNSSSLIPSLSSFLSLYPSLSSLILLSSPTNQTLSNHILISIASTCSNLRHLRFSAASVSYSSLLLLSSSCKHLTSLTISSSLPLSFNWVSSLPSLLHLSFTNSTDKPQEEEPEFQESDEVSRFSKLPLQSLCLSGIGAGDRGLGWLWRRCTQLKKLELRSCQGIGDGNSMNSITKCLHTLQELELRTCRTIVDGILFQLAENGSSLDSLLIYDGCSKQGLQWFVNQTKSSLTNLRKLDFRLPLDLENNHLLSMAENFNGLVSLRLESCCVVTGEGLRTLASTVGSGFQELSLINCDMVEREQGLLTTLGQNLKGLKKLDLSYNEMLVDKELVSMLVSCKNLVEIKLRGCKKITSFAMVAMSNSCKVLVSVDIVHCKMIEAEGVEGLILNSTRLRRVQVEESKLSNVAMNWACQKYIEVSI